MAARDRVTAPDPAASRADEGRQGVRALQDLARPANLTGSGGFLAPGMMGLGMCSRYVLGMVHVGVARCGAAERIAVENKTDQGRSRM